MSLHGDVLDQPYFLQDEDGSIGILIALDVCEVAVVLKQCKQFAKSKKMIAAVDDLVHLFEFAPVSILKNGTVKWKSGEFVVGD